MDRCLPTRAALIGFRHFLDGCGGTRQGGKGKAPVDQKLLGVPPQFCPELFAPCSGGRSRNGAVVVVCPAIDRPGEGTENGGSGALFNGFVGNERHNRLQESRKSVFPQWRLTIEVLVGLQNQVMLEKMKAAEVEPSAI